MRQHARARRALLPRVHEGGAHDRRHGLVEIGIGVDDRAVLPSHLRDHPLDVRLIVRRLRRRPDDPEPHRTRSGERDHVHPGVANQRLTGVAEPGQQRHRAPGDARLAQRRRQHQRRARRLLGRLQDDRIARGQAGGGHPGRDGEREVPRRDHRDNAARLVAHLVPLAGRLHELRPARQPHGLARVVLEEVDRLAHVGVGLGPRLRALAHLQGGELQPALAQDPGGAHEHLGPTGRAAGAPVRKRLGGSADRSVGLLVAGARGHGDEALGVSRIRRLERVLRRGRQPIDAQDHRDLEGKLPVQLLQRRQKRFAHVAPAQLQRRLVGERPHGGGGASSSSIDTPRACSWRNDSFDVFSSNRRTRYAMPATSSPTGQ